MANPLIQNPGQNYTNINGVTTATGITTTNASYSGNGTTAVGTAVVGLTGTIGSIFYKGSLVVLGSNGHAPDYLGAQLAANGTSLTLGSSASGAGASTVQVFQFPGLFSPGDSTATPNGSTVTSSYYVGTTGVGGVVCLTDVNNAIYADIVFIAGGAFTPTAGGYIQGWFIRSYDNGVTFEKVVANTAPPRTPDFIIPLYASAYAAGDRAYAPDVNLPAEPFETVIQNEAGVTLAAKWGIWLLPGGVELTT